MARKFKRLLLRISDIEDLEEVSYRTARNRYRSLRQSLNLLPHQKPNIAQYAQWMGWDWRIIMEVISK